YGQQPSLADGHLSRKQVRLTRADMEMGLPQVCICCGDHAEFWIERTYRVPREVDEGWSALGAVSLAVTGIGWTTFKGGGRFQARIPFCGKHSRHWRWRRLAILCAIPIAVIGAVALYSLMPPGNEPWLLLPLVICFLLAVCLRETGVHSIEVRP